MNMSLIELRKKAVTQLRNLHGSQSGAVAFLCLAAILIILMLGLVVFDTSTAARQKLEVQAAADMSSFSQSAVEARSMNMIAFANVGKRVLVSQAVFYEALWAGWAALLIIIAVLAVIACVACLIAVGCVPCEKLAAIALEIGFVMGQEAEDGGAFITQIRDKIIEDLTAFDDYQDYMSRLTPWWGFAENFYRGGRNGALVTVGWPVPRILTDDIGLAGTIGSGTKDALPVKKASDYRQLCKESYDPDFAFHIATHSVQTLLCGSDCLSNRGTSVIPRPVLYLLALGLAIAAYAALCPTFAESFTEAGRPYEMDEGVTSPESAWLLASSNLSFAYRPGVKLMSDWREKYGFLNPDYEYSATSLGLGQFFYKADGYLSIARSEISFQDGTPDLWHAAWGARMRPVGLPGEWEAYGSTRMLTAFHDVAPLMIGGSVALGFVGQGMGEPELNDLLKAEIMFDAMTDDGMNGVSK